MPNSPRRRLFAKKPLRVLNGIRNGLSALLGFVYQRVVIPVIPPWMARDYRGLVLALSAIIGGIVLSTVVFMIIWMYQHTECFTREVVTTWREGQAHETKRECPAVPYRTDPAAFKDPSRICLTTLKDSRNAKSSYRFLRCRNFDDVSTFPNHQAYAKKHGYTIVDASPLLDLSRPPAWSKILAAQSMMNDYDCEWVMWLDADTVIMNSSIRLETLIPSGNDDTQMIDLVVTTDRKFTANSGAWLIRNSPWGHEFLNEWWNMRNFVRPKGLSLSGDNDAFGHMVRKRVGASGYPNEKEFQAMAATSHIRVAARCNFNSFGVFVSKDVDLSRDPKPEWYLSDQFYHEGDFIAHASGIDQKDVGVKLLLNRAK